MQYAQDFAAILQVQSDGRTVTCHCEQSITSTLRLPAYHCTLNPIKLSWADLKFKIAWDNTTFKLDDVRQMVHDVLERISQCHSAFNNCCLRRSLENIS